MPQSCWDSRGALTIVAVPGSVFVGSVRDRDLAAGRGRFSSTAAPRRRIEMCSCVGTSRAAYLWLEPGKKLQKLVMLDLNLPKVGGLEVLRRIRADERTKLLPVVILTSWREERDLIDGYSSGADSYVVKPIDFIQFAEAVRELGLYWILRNEPLPAGISPGPGG